MDLTFVHGADLFGSLRFLKFFNFQGKKPLMWMTLPRYVNDRRWGGWKNILLLQSLRSKISDEPSHGNSSKFQRKLRKLLVFEGKKSSKLCA
jgi:hypothetical protein